MIKYSNYTIFIIGYCILTWNICQGQDGLAGRLAGFTNPIIITSVTSNVSTLPSLSPVSIFPTNPSPLSFNFQPLPVFDTNPNQSTTKVDNSQRQNNSNFLIPISAGSQSQNFFLTLKPIIDRTNRVKLFIASNGTHMDIQSFPLGPDGKEILSSEPGMSFPPQGTKELLTIDDALDKYNLTQLDDGIQDNISDETIEPDTGNVNPGANTPPILIVSTLNGGKDVFASSSQVLVQNNANFFTKNIMSPRITVRPPILIDTTSPLVNRLVNGDKKIFFETNDADNLSSFIIDNMNNRDISSVLQTSVKQNQNDSLLILLKLNNDSVPNSRMIGSLGLNGLQDLAVQVPFFPENFFNSSPVSNIPFTTIPNDLTFAPQITLNRELINGSNPTINISKPFFSTKVADTAKVAIKTKPNYYELNFTIVEGLNFSAELLDPWSQKHKMLSNYLEPLVEKSLSTRLNKSVHVLETEYSKGSVQVKMILDVPSVVDNIALAKSPNNNKTNMPYDSTAEAFLIADSFNQSLADNNYTFGQRYRISPQQISVKEFVPGLPHRTIFPAYKATAIVIGILAFLLVLAVIIVLILALQQTKEAWNVLPVKGLNYYTGGRGYNHNFYATTQQKDVHVYNNNHQRNNTTSNYQGPIGMRSNTIDTNEENDSFNENESSQPGQINNNQSTGLPVGNHRYSPKRIEIENGILVSSTSHRVQNRSSKQQQSFGKQKTPPSDIEGRGRTGGPFMHSTSQKPNVKEPSLGSILSRRDSTGLSGIIGKSPFVRDDISNNNYNNTNRFNNINTNGNLVKNMSKNKNNANISNDDLYINMPSKNPNFKDQNNKSDVGDIGKTASSSKNAQKNITKSIPNSARSKFSN